MREYKFKGFSKSKNAWIIGFGAKEIKVKEENTAILCTNKGYEQVYPNSVGQYTGRKDINGQDIYERDLVRLDIDSMSDLNLIFSSITPDSVFYGEVKFYDGSFYIDNGMEACLLFQEINQIEIVGSSFII